jgi:hypothetical protein
MFLQPPRNRAASHKLASALHGIEAVTVAAGILMILLTYGAAGLIVAIAFVSYGVTRVLPTPVTATLGARLLLIPGAVVLWPFVLKRWRMTRNFR